MASPLSSAPDKTAMLRRLLTIHLHGETGNFGRKIKWSASSFGKLQKIWAWIEGDSIPPPPPPTPPLLLLLPFLCLADWDILCSGSSPITLNFIFKDVQDFKGTF